VERAEIDYRLIGLEDVIIVPTDGTKIVAV
jgi:hypothetical protein